MWSRYLGLQRLLWVLREVGVISFYIVIIQQAQDCIRVRCRLRPFDHLRPILTDCGRDGRWRWFESGYRRQLSPPEERIRRRKHGQSGTINHHTRSWIERRLQLVRSRCPRRFEQQDMGMCPAVRIPVLDQVQQGRYHREGYWLVLLPVRNLTK